MQVNVKMQNDQKIRRAAKGKAVLLKPVHRFLARAGFIVEQEAKERATVDTGRLRASIGSTVETSKLQAIIGTPVTYAPHVEFGTRSHFPPLGALQPWAQRHGFPPGNAGAFMVARAIARRGTRPRPFLGPALKASRVRIARLLRATAKEVEVNFRRLTR